MRGGFIQQLCLSVATLLLIVFSEGCGAAQTRPPTYFDVSDRAALARGFIYFVNYCSGCHQLEQLRYPQVKGDLADTVSFSANDKARLAGLSLPMHKTSFAVSMPPADASRWFGRLPPDLSNIAGLRGPNWLFDYLTSFYNDLAKPYGCNNRLVPNVNMPNVLFERQMSADTFTGLVEDIVTFLVYAAEPHQLQRRQMGPWVVTYMLLLTLLIFLIKKYIF